MAVKRRHFTSKTYQEAQSSSSEESSSEGEAETKPRVSKLPKIGTIHSADTDENKGLYKVIETKNLEETTSHITDVPGSADDKDSDDDEAEEEEEDSSDEEEDEDTSSEEEETPILKPVFLPKHRRTNEEQKPLTSLTDKKKDITLQKLQHNISTKIAMDKLKLKEASYADREDIGDIDDTDNLDPDAEYELWKLRELDRLRRHRDKLITKEREEEEIYKRREEYDEGVLLAAPELTKQKSIGGAFFKDSDIIEKLQQRSS